MDAKAPTLTAKLDRMNRAVGNNVRTLRTAAGMSQTQLGDIIGVTFQQVQKYEKGTNRLSAGRLAVIADLFGVPISLLFQGVASKEEDPTSPGAYSIEEVQMAERIVALASDDRAIIERILERLRT